MPREVVFEVERRVELRIVVPDDMTDDEVRSVLREQGDDFLSPYPRAGSRTPPPDVRKLRGKTITMDEAIELFDTGDSYRMNDSRTCVVFDDTGVDWIEDSLTAQGRRAREAGERVKRAGEAAAEGVRAVGVAGAYLRPVDGVGRLPNLLAEHRGGCDTCAFGNMMCGRLSPDAAGQPLTDAIVAWLEEPAVVGCPGWAPRPPRGEVVALTPEVGGSAKRSTDVLLVDGVPALSMTCDHSGGDGYHCATCCPGDCAMHAKGDGSP